MHLTFEKAQLIRELRRDGMSVMQICRDFNVGESTVYRILNGVTHRTPPEGPKVASTSNSFQQGQRSGDLVDHFAASGVTMDDIPEGTVVDSNSSPEDIARMLAAFRNSIGK